MAYQRWWKTVRDQQGNAINGATCTVYNGGLGTLATVYDPNSNDSSPSGLSNPFITSANGRFGFMAPDGEYDVVIEGGSIASQQFRILLGAGGVTISAKDYGIVGDGITDNTVAVQNAIDFLDSIGGGVLAFPAGEFVWSTVTIPSSNITIDGGGATFRKATGTNGYLIKLQGSGSKVVPVENLTIRNATLVGDPYTYASGGISAATTTATDQINGLTLENLVIKSFGQYGVFVGSVSHLTCKNIRVDDHGSLAGSSAIGIGFVIYPRDAQSDIHLENIYSRINPSTTIAASSAIKIQVASRVMATNITAINGTEEILVIDATDKSIYQGIFIENESATPTLGLVFISNDSTSSPVVSNAQYSAYGIRIKGAMSSCISMSNSNTYGLTIDGVDTSQATTNRRMVVAAGGVCDSCTFKNMDMDIRTDAYVSTTQNCLFENCKTAGGWFAITGNNNTLKSCSLVDASGKFDITGNGNILQNCMNIRVAAGFECFKVTGDSNYLINCIGRGSSLGKNLSIVSGTGNIVSACVFGDTANRIVDAGTGTIFNGMIGPVAAGATTATLGTASPATVTTPYLWETCYANDGTKCFRPLWK